MNKRPKILLVEDEENFGSLLQNYLHLSKYVVDWARDGALGYSKYCSNNYDLCIFDVMMPHMDGFTLLEKIRKKNHTTPVVFLTAKGQKADILQGYRLGACDYLTKPFDVEVLIMKIEVILGLSHKESADMDLFQLGMYRYEVATRTLTFKGTSRRLSPKEGSLLHLLCRYMNEVLPRDKALKEIWSEDSYFTTRSMDVFISKLRKYLSEDPSISIENVLSSGYRLIVSP